MENFFCEINAIEKLQTKISTMFPNEKICFLMQNNFDLNSLVLNLLKTNVIEQDETKLNSPSVKAVVCSGSAFFVKQIIAKCETNAKIFVVFNDFKELLNHTFEANKNIFYFVNPACVLNKGNKIKSALIEKIGENILCLQDLFLINLNCEKENLKCKNYLKNNIELLLFLEKTENINLFNYGIFSNLLKDFIGQKLKNIFNISSKTRDFFNYENGQNISSCECSFLISFVLNKFVKSKSFFKLKADNFYKKFEFHKAILKNGFCENALKKSFFGSKIDLFLLEKIKCNCVELLKFNEKIFKLNCLILKKMNNNFNVLNKNIDAKKFLKSLSFASDYASFGLCKLMRDLGFLNAC